MPNGKMNKGHGFRVEAQRQHADTTKKAGLGAEQPQIPFGKRGFSSWALAVCKPSGTGTSSKAKASYSGIMWP